MNERIMYIDGWNVLIAQNAVSYLTDYNSNPSGMYLTSLNMIRTFVEKFKPRKVFFVLDGPEAGERRRELYPDYKGKRRITARKSKVQIMEGEDNMIYGSEGAFQNQLIKIYEFLKLLPITVVSVPCCEADDVISYLVLKNKDKENIIVSNDRDYLQLVSDSTFVYRWKAKKIYGNNTFQEEFKINPENFIYRKVLLGDTSDRIEGIKGIGEKTFIEIAPELLKPENKFESIDDFIRYFESLDLSTFSTRTRNSLKKILLEENRPKLVLSYILMKLDENCMSPDQIEVLKLQMEEQLSKPFSRFLTKIKMQKDQFNKLYIGFNDEKWLQPFSFLKINFPILS